MKNKLDKTTYYISTNQKSSLQDSNIHSSETSAVSCGLILTTAKAGRFSLLSFIIIVYPAFKFIDNSSPELKFCAFCRVLRFLVQVFFFSCTEV